MTLHLNYSTNKAAINKVFNYLINFSGEIPNLIIIIQKQV